MVPITRRVSLFLVFFLYVPNTRLRDEQEGGGGGGGDRTTTTDLLPQGYNIIILSIKYINTLETILSQTQTTPPNPTFITQCKYL